MRVNCLRKWLEYHIRKGRDRNKILRFALAFFSGFLPKHEIIRIYRELCKEYPTLDIVLCKQEANNINREVRSDEYKQVSNLWV